MSKYFMSLLSLVAIVVLAGCSQPATIPAEGGDSGHQEKKEGADIAVPAPAEAPAAPAEAPAAPAAPAEAPAAPAAPAPSASAAPLTSTTWAWKGIQVAFLEGDKVSLKGGAIASFAPEGAEATYKVTDGVLAVELMGKTYDGTWDGAKLVIDGTEATKQP